MFAWSIDPTFFSLPDVLGGRGVRYYGVLFALGLMGGYYVWQWQMLRGGHTRERAERVLTMGVIGVIAGSRLGHCFFYEPARYLANPIEILYFWQGGLASHGATIGVIIALFYFAWREKMTSLEVFDRFAIPVTLATVTVRLGNFMNSEIVGRVTNGPLKVKFPRHDLRGIHRELLPACTQACTEVKVGVCTMYRGVCTSLDTVPWRHPSQLYEAGMGLAVMAILFVIDRKLGEKNRKLGLLSSLFFLLYFSARFIVEFFKEYQTRQSGLTMGQMLSMPFIAYGVYGVVRALTREPAAKANSEAA